MKTILLIGLGHFGSKVAKQLYDYNCEVMGIDISEEKVEDALPFLDDGQIGDSTNATFLKSIGISNFDIVINAIGGNFKASLETTLLLKECGAKFIVARADDDVHEELLLKVGADKVLNPEKQIARWTAVRYGTSHVLDFISIDSDYAVFELEVPSEWMNKTVGELNIRKNYSINIVAIRKDGKFSPDITPSTEFTKGTTILVLGEAKTIEKKFHVVSK